MNSFNYENRFAAVPKGVVFPASGRDGDGVVFVIASDASAGATSPTDLEVYVMDANIGGDMTALTGDVTTGTANAVNHLYVSTDGNVVVGQRCKTSAKSGGSRATLNGDSDLFAVTNVHEVLAGGAPVSFVLSAGMSHGSAVGFVGEATVTGPQALVYSAAPKGTNTTWKNRKLMLVPLVPGGQPAVLDDTASHYVVLGGTRVLDDDPTSPN